MKELLLRAQHRLDKDKEFYKTLEGYISQTKRRQKIRLSKSHGRTQYYLCDCTNKTRKYIRLGDLDRIKKYAQIEYTELFMKYLNKEIQWLERVIRTAPNEEYKRIYENKPNRMKLIVPYSQPDEVYVRNWENTEYQRKGFEEGAPEFYTEKGERVRSKSEMLIANKYLKLGIPYRVEYPVKLFN